MITNDVKVDNAQLAKAVTDPAMIDSAKTDFAQINTDAAMAMIGYIKKQYLQDIEDSANERKESKDKSELLRLRTEIEATLIMLAQAKEVAQAQPDPRNASADDIAHTMTVLVKILSSLPRPDMLSDAAMNVNRRNVMIGTLATLWGVSVKAQEAPKELNLVKVEGKEFKVGDTINFQDKRWIPRVITGITLAQDQVSGKWTLTINTTSKSGPKTSVPTVLKSNTPNWEEFDLEFEIMKSFKRIFLTQEQKDNLVKNKITLLEEKRGDYTIQMSLSDLNQRLSDRELMYEMQRKFREIIGRTDIPFYTAGFSMRNNVATLTLTTMPSPGGVVIGNNRDDEDETMTPTGGIDMNSANMALVIKRDGKGVPLPLAQQDRAQLSRISGFVPHIIEIKPITSLAAFSRLRE